MQTIALFGATGQTGKLVLKMALDQGYQIKALVRDPKKVDYYSNNLTIVKGDVLNYENVETTIKDCDLVVSLFGHVKNSPEWLQTNGTNHIVKAMNRFGIRKIISLSGGGLPFPEKDQPKFADKLIRAIMKIAFSKVLDDAIQHSKVLKESGLDWVIIRGPRLTNEKPKESYRVGWVGVNSGTKIARADLSDFILKQVDSDDFIHQMPFVSY